MKLNDIGFYTLYDERVKNTSETSQMKRCELIITNRCNFNCLYCRGLSPEKKELSFKEAKQCIDYWCDGQPLENIRFSGGEPTLHPDIKEIISYARKSGIKRIAVSTNGSNDLKLYKELIDRGVNDYSISLDACCSEDGEKMSGGVKKSWDKVTKNIKELSKLTYVTVGIVLTADNDKSAIDTIMLADQLGVSDIRVIASAQYNKLSDLGELTCNFLSKYPILKYRVLNFVSGICVRGLEDSDNNKCPLAYDDSVVAGDFHFPCVIYMREGGKPIGKVSKDMRQDRVKWLKEHDCQKDKICKNNCLDVCIEYNNKYREIFP